MTPTIGQQLKAAREARRLTLEKVFDATRIRIQYLQALEADDMSVMPSPVQARGYLRNYAEFLGLDVDRVLSDLRGTGAQQSREIIGPADEYAPPPQTSVPPAETPWVAPVPEVPAIVDQSAPTEAPAATTTSVTVPLKPKPGRRKKAESPAKPAAAETTTKRRSRKKAEQEPAPILESAPAIPPVAEPIPAPEPRPQEPVVPTETWAEAVVAEDSATPPETAPAADAGDRLWQSWLNRLGSRLSMRMRRKTLVPKEAPRPEPDPVDAPTEEDAFAVVTVAGDWGSSTEIFKEIGRELRSRRELLSLHFEEVERNTHVKAHYLDALERGMLDELPSTVQTRGMLSNYARFLDLDVDAILLRFADALQARHRERNPYKPARKPGEPIIANIPPVRSFIAGDMIFGVGMAILLVGFAIWGVSRVMAIQSQQEVQPTAPSISQVLLASPDPASFTATPTFLPVEAFPGEPTVTLEIPTQNANAPVQLNLVAVERTYMRVTVDGEVTFEGRVVPGNAYPFEAESQVEVLVGSGAAIRTVYNGRDLGLMGTFGQIVNVVYTGTEILTPTALPTATGTITLTPTRTEPPSATPRFTSTPVPSATAVP